MQQINCSFVAFATNLNSLMSARWHPFLCWTQELRIGNDMSTIAITPAARTWNGGTITMAAGSCLLSNAIHARMRC